MTFNNGKEILEEIIKFDLYNKEKGIYVFEYNECGSICYYYIDNEEFSKLKKEAEEKSVNISSLLGVGGWICDDPSHELFLEGDYSNLDWCNDNYKGEWEYV